MKARFQTKETILYSDLENRNFPAFGVGDNIDVSLIVKEGDKERVQLFSGDVIAMHNNGISSTFTVRTIASNGIGVEKILPYYSPIISGIRLVKKGVVRRAKLYYIRKRVGKAARIQEKILTRTQKEHLQD